MSNKKLKLKDFVEDEEFIGKMNAAFSDLRADYELSMDVDRAKVNELRELHIDNCNFLGDITSYSIKSSGVISGLRGTGKTHLFLLARHNINEKMQDNKAFCVYLNVKRLHLPTDCNTELFNRVFSVFIYDQISTQLKDILMNIEEPSLWDKFKSLFDDKSSFSASIYEALVLLSKFKEIAYIGNEEYSEMGVGEVHREEYNKELLALQAKISSELGLEKVQLKSELNEQSISEISDSITKNNNYTKYLNIENVRQHIILLLKTLRLETITFYVDEWEKLYHREKHQSYMSYYIDKMIDTPIYFWIGIVPYRGGLQYLDNGADLQHEINLDESLIYENSEFDKKTCIAYFKQLINKRLYFYFNDDSYNYSILFNDERKFEKLVLASMGNSRDFGTMLLNCWSAYKSYRTSQLSQGRPFQYISNDMLVKSLKNNGDKKLSNIKDDECTMKVWREIERFCILKSSSHFAIEETNENMTCLYNKEYSELMYHRLLHFRKGHVSPKDKEILNKLSIYALNYTTSYDLHSKDRTINFVTDYSTIHDKVRRYLFNPLPIINNIKITEGEVFPCANCKENINIRKMTAAWERNSCPFCGGVIRNE